MAKALDTEYKYGDALATVFGIPRETVLSTQAHILSALAGPTVRFKVQGVSWPFRSGGLILTGSQARTGALIDQLLSPVHEIQRIRTHARQPMREIIEQQNFSPDMDIQFRELRSIDKILALPDKREESVRELGQTALNRKTAMHPLLLLDNTPPDKVLPLLTDSKDNSPLWLDRDCRLLQSGTRIFEKLGSYLTGQAYNPGKDADTRFSQLCYLATVEQELLSDIAATNIEVIRQLQRHSTVLILPELNADDKPDCRHLDTDLKAELDVWESAVARAIELRDNEIPWHASNLHTSPAEIHRRRRANLDHIANNAVATDGQIVNDLLAKLLFGLSLLEQEGAQFGNCPFSIAAGLHLYLFQHHNNSDQWLQEQSHKSALDKDKARLVRALERRGPCTWAQLRRSFDNQKREAHDAAINSLIAEGRLQLDDIGTFQLRATGKAA